MSRKSLLSAVDKTTERTLIVAQSIPKGLWGQEFPNRFGPGEVVAHLVLATRFFSAFLFPQVGVGEPFVPHPSLAPLLNASGAELRNLITAGNLAQARQYRKSHSRDEVIEAYAFQRNRIVDLTLLVPEDSYETTVHHPLVEWSDTFEVIFSELFIDHDAEHRGNIGGLIKELGGQVPFHSGEISDD